MICIVENRTDPWHCEISGLLGLEIGLVFMCVCWKEKLVTKEVCVELLQAEPLPLIYYKCDKILLGVFANSRE
jgi:hypothetical protein